MPPPTSSTHAGGIQPSASFFRPSRPNQPQYSPQHDLFPLENIQKRHSDVSQDAVPSRTGTPTNASSNTSNLVRNSVDRVFNLSRGMSMDDSANRNVEQSFDEDERPTTSSSNKMGMGMKETVIPQAGLDEETDDDFNFGHRRSRYKSGGSNSSDSPVPSPNARTRQLELQRRRRSSFSTSQTHASFSGPAAYATLASVPIVNPKTNKPMRNYQLHPSRNKFLFGGRLLLGGDSPWAFIFCFTIVLAISGLWFGATCPWWWRNEGAGGKVLVIIGAYLAAMVITSMLTTATMDPGILPRNLDPDPPYPANSPSDGGVRAPMPRDLKRPSQVLSYVQDLPAPEIKSL
uniref:Uncharacterized protein n=1 Tax=Moniliophthora roreri TaxID=221103 RepID=A0A0W0FL68_MONRR